RRAPFEEARRAAERAVCLVPSDPYAHAQLGSVLSELERETPPLASRAEVEQAFGSARGLDRNNSLIHVAAATAALAAGDHELVVSWAELASRLYPRSGAPR